MIPERHARQVGVARAPRQLPVAEGEIRDAFADALAARLADHLSRYAELGVSDSWTALEDEVYGLMQSASIDWGRTSAADPKHED